VFRKLNALALFSVPLLPITQNGNPANPSSASQDSTTQELIKRGLISGPDDPEVGFYASLVRTFGAETWAPKR
jgi:hypothetical protein